MMVSGILFSSSGMAHESASAQTEISVFRRELIALTTWEIATILSTLTQHSLLSIRLMPPILLSQVPKTSALVIVAP